MDRRTHESPMDWEYQDNGPVDVTSPFSKLLQGHGQRRGFESPSKPAIPRQLGNSSIFGSSVANTATPFRNPSFTTPRKPFDLDMFSETSGAESSPADNADTEDTPEMMKPGKEITTFISDLSKKKPLFGDYGIQFAAHSPGRGEILRRGKYHPEHKVRKRRRIDRDLTQLNGRRGSSDYDSDFDDTRTRGRKENAGQLPLKESWFVSVLKFIDSKPELPSVLSYYAQLLLNSFLVCCVIYGVYSFWCTIRADVDKAAEVEMLNVLAEIEECRKKYVDNKCQPPNRVPALEQQCEAWHRCQDRDPHKVGRARVSAHTFAEIINSFVEPISWKTMIMFLMTIAVIFGLNNFLFSWFRTKASHPMPIPQYYAPPAPAPSERQEYSWQMPQTPRHPSHSMEQGGFEGDMSNNFSAIMPSQTPGRSRSPRKGSWN